MLRQPFSVEIQHLLHNCWLTLLIFGLGSSTIKWRFQSSIIAVYVFLHKKWEKILLQFDLECEEWFFQLLSILLWHISKQTGLYAGKEKGKKRFQSNCLRSDSDKSWFLHTTRDWHEDKTLSCCVYESEHFCLLQTNTTEGLWSSGSACDSNSFLKKIKIYSSQERINLSRKGSINDSPQTTLQTSDSLLLWL